MKLKLSEIVNCVQSLRILGAEKMPVRLAYNIQRNLRLLETEASTYEKTRQELIRKEYGVETEDKSFKVPPEKMEDFIEAMDKIGEEIIKLDVHTIDMAELGEMKVSPNSLKGLEWMFVE